MSEPLNYKDLEMMFDECSRGVGVPDCLLMNLGMVRRMFPKTPWLLEMADFPDSTAIMVHGGLVKVVDGTD